MGGVASTGRRSGLRGRQIYSGRMAEVSVWVDELQDGRLPPVCVKSGRAADAKLTFRFETRRGAVQVVDAVTTLPIGGWGARRAGGPLPLTKRWRAPFIALPAITITPPPLSAALPTLLLPPRPPALHPRRL